MTHVVFICETCQDQDDLPKGRAFADALSAALGDTDIEVQTVACLNMCDEPLSLALGAPGKSAYLFSGVDPEMDLADAAALAQVYRHSKGSEIEDARPAGRLRFCLKGRVPPL